MLLFCDKVQGGANFSLQSCSRDTGVREEVGGRRTAHPRPLAKILNLLHSVHPAENTYNSIQEDSVQSM